MSDPVVHIAVCICTYKRPVLLGQLLEKLVQQRTDGLFTVSITVVDNDTASSANETVARAQRTETVPISYHVENERNISLARNRSIDNSHGDLIALIDDDEFPDADWLLTLFLALKDSTASGVLGPVRPHFSDRPPDWLVKSKLLERQEFTTGTPLTDSQYTRTGNALLRRSLFADRNFRFDPRFGRSGGGDAAFFKKLIESGHLFIWCNEAVVHETIPPERQKKSYYLKRAFTRGMTEAQNVPFLSWSTVRSLVAIPLYAAALPLARIVGQHIFMRYLVKECDHLSKILAYMGIRLVKERPY